MTHDETYKDPERNKPKYNSEFKLKSFIPNEDLLLIFVQLCITKINTNNSNKGTGNEKV